MDVLEIAMMLCDALNEICANDHKSMVNVKRIQRALNDKIIEELEARKKATTKAVEQGLINV